LRLDGAGAFCFPVSACCDCAFCSIGGGSGAYIPKLIKATTRRGEGYDARNDAR
jgi:hypothetical protein